MPLSFVLQCEPGLRSRQQERRCLVIFKKQMLVWEETETKATADSRFSSLPGGEPGSSSASSPFLSLLHQAQVWGPQRPEMESTGVAVSRSEQRTAWRVTPSGNVRHVFSPCDILGVTERVARPWSSPEHPRWQHVAKLERFDGHARLVPV